MAASCGASSGCSITSGESNASSSHPRHSPPWPAPQSGRHSACNGTGGGIVMSVPVLFLAAALGIAALPQQPASAPPRPSSNAPDDRLATLAPPAPVAVEGCVATEREIKGRASDVGERTGLNNHFVLTAAKVLKGRASAVAAAGPLTYAIDGLTDEQL